MSHNMANISHQVILDLCHIQVNNFHLVYFTRVRAIKLLCEAVILGANSIICLPECTLKWSKGEGILMDLHLVRR